MDQMNGPDGPDEWTDECTNGPMSVDQWTYEVDQMDGPDEWTKCARRPLPTGTLSAVGSSCASATRQHAASNSGFNRPAGGSSAQGNQSSHVHSHRHHHAHAVAVAVVVAFVAFAFIQSTPRRRVAGARTCS